MEKTITVYVTPDPFKERLEARLPYIEGETLFSAVKRACPDRELHSFSGDVDELVRPGGVYHAWNLPKATAALDALTPFMGPLAPLAAILRGAIVVAGIMASGAAVSYGVSYLTSKLFSKKIKNKYNKSVEDLSDTQYGWDYNARNAVAEGSPVPILYGRRAIIPPVIEQHIHYKDSNDKNDQYLYVTFAIADGGSGFDDTISYPTDGSDIIYAWIEHAFWTNYFSGVNSEDAMTKNRLYTAGASNPAVLRNADIANMDSVTGTAFGEANDGVTTNGVDSYDFGVVYFALPQAIKPYKCVVYSYGDGATHGVLKTAVLSGYRESSHTWQAIGTIKNTSRHGSGWKKCTMQISLDSSTEEYSRFCISDWTWGTPSAGLHAISEIQIFGPTSGGGSSVLDYIQLRANSGSYDQSKVSFTNYTYASLEVNKVLDTESFVFQTTPGAYPDRLTLYLSFPYGLYGLSNAGELEDKSVRVSARYRAVGADGQTGAWTNFGNGFTPVRTITAAKNSALSFAYNTAVTPAYCFDVEVKLAEEPDVGTGEAADCHWISISESWHFSCAYPKTATLGFMLLATKFINGDMPQFKIIAERPYVNVWNGIAEEWQPKPAGNPAWAAWDLLCHPRFDDRTLSSPNDAGALLSEQMPHSLLVYSDFKRWADYCDSQGITMSIYYDGNMTVRNALQYICEVGRANIVNRGSMIGVIVDKPADTVDGEPVVAYEFDDDNVVADSWKVSYRRQGDFPHQIQVTYYDRERQWNRAAIVVSDSEFDSARQTNTKEVTLYACDDKAVAKAFADYYLRTNMIKRTFEWKGDIGTLPLEVGDLVKLYGDYVTITNISQDDDYHRVFSGMEYVAERFEPTPGPGPEPPTPDPPSGETDAFVVTYSGMPVFVAGTYVYDGQEFNGAPVYSNGSGMYLYRIHYLENYGYDYGMEYGDYGWVLNEQVSDYAFFDAVQTDSMTVPLEGWRNIESIVKTTA